MEHAIRERVAEDSRGRASGAGCCCVGLGHGAGLWSFRREEVTIERVADDQRDADADEQPEQIPRQSFEDLAAVRVAADPEQLHDRRRRAEKNRGLRALGYASRIARVTRFCSSGILKWL